MKCNFLPLTLLLASSCQSVETTTLADFAGGDDYANFFTEVFPPDIAVMPVQDLTGKNVVPTEPLRTAVRRTLLDQGYSALAPSFLDTRFEAVPASAVQIADTGVLEIQVHSWDATQAASLGLLKYDLEIMIHGPEGVLAALRDAGQLELSPAMLAGVASQGRLSRMVKELAADLLASLPAPPPL